MPDSPNKLSKFWQDLSRRKLVRVVKVYIIAAALPGGSWLSLAVYILYKQFILSS